MSKPKLVVAQPSLPPETGELLGQNYELIYTDPKNPDVLYRDLAQATGLFPAALQVDEALLSRAPLLRIASDVGVGYNNFHIDAMRRRRVLGTNTPFVLDDAVADAIVGLMLACARRISELDRYVKEGRWTGKEGRGLFGLEFSKKTLGIIGMGRIGQAVARRCRLGFSMNVLYHNRNPLADSLGAAYTDMDTLLRTSDYVLVMTPLTRETENMIGLEQFQKMKRTAIFINASRGDVIREEDLIEALSHGLLYGAGIDVYQQEPVDPANPLLRFPNVVTTPHIGSSTHETRDAMFLRAAQNMCAFAAGLTPPDVVPELLQDANLTE